MGLVQQPVEGVPKQGHDPALVQLLQVVGQTVQEMPQRLVHATNTHALVSFVKLLHQF